MKHQAILGPVLAAAMAVSAAAIAPAAGAATATPGPSSVAADCLNIGLTRREGNDIIGYGSNSCFESGQIKIQWSRWFGWEDVTLTALPNDGRDHEVRWNCTNSGIHDFRTVVLLQSGAAKASNVLTAQNCGG